VSLFKTAARLLGACAVICVASFAFAQQNYPAKPITLLISFPWAPVATSSAASSETA